MTQSEPSISTDQELVTELANNVAALTDAIDDLRERLDSPIQHQHTSEKAELHELGLGTIIGLAAIVVLFGLAVTANIHVTVTHRTVQTTEAK